MALSKKISCRQAIQRFYDIEEAVALARPYSAAVLSYAVDFLYEEGVLCYLHTNGTANEIRVLDVHNAANTEHVLNMANILPRIIRDVQGRKYGPAAQISLLHYSSGILAMLVEVRKEPIGERLVPWLVVLDVTLQRHEHGRVRFCTELDSAHRIFVRHTESFLFFGTHTYRWGDGYRRWAVHIVDLRSRKLLTADPAILDLAGHDIGQSICFEIFHGHLYAVSNMVSFEDREDEQTSFYMWVCLPPTGKVVRPRPHWIWRRQHNEGPIHDLWTQISLRQDKQTGQLMIFECRREWRGGASDSVRTCYCRPLLSDIQSSSGSSEPPIYAPSERRLPRDVHAEYTSEDDCLQKIDFILANVRYRTYNSYASTFLDLVNDPQRDPPYGIPQDQLRLRTRSRKRKGPLDDRGMLIPLETSSGEPIPGSEERFISRRIELWPPDNVSEAVGSLLRSSTDIAGIRAMADERSLVYLADVKDNLPVIILISFDPNIRIPSMQRPDGEGTKSQLGGSEAPIRVDQWQAEGKNKDAIPGGNKPSFRVEEAMHLAIDQGYWFR
jgi:hypothetical protein